MKPFLVWLLVCAFGAAGCRATSKLATCGDGVEPITGRRGFANRCSSAIEHFGATS